MAQASSGISREEQLPKLLEYPKPLSDLVHVTNIFSYVIRHPGDNGFAVLILRQPAKDQVIVACGDWYGNRFDLIDDNSRETNVASKFINNDVVKFTELMRAIGIDQAQFYFAYDEDELILYDVQLALDKFAGPGMVKDVFGKMYRIPEVLKTEVIDDRALEYINKGTGPYQGDLLIKPSRFRMFYDEQTKKYHPLYVEVRR